jgi:adenylylsulfate reductase subunit A
MMKEYKEGRGPIIMKTTDALQKLGETMSKKRAQTS